MRLIAEFATSYYELMALGSQLEIVKECIFTLEQAQQVVEMQMFGGRTTSLAVKRFTAETLRNKSRKYQIQQQIVITENKLNTLVGRLPQSIERKSQGFIEIAMQSINAGTPADLIENRPDIHNAALKMKATKLNVKSVKAEFYPSLNIDVNLGYQSFNSKYLISPQTGAYAIAGGLTAPLLNRKAIKAEYFSANGEQIKALYVYEQAFIKGFSEVLNQLTSLENLKNIHSYKLQQTHTLSESFEISDILFKAARIDYLESLLTRRDYLESRIELVEIKKQQLSTYVNLYKALGGGWRK
jgi:multidrug efflux system outer membrane protein